jgi:hypothetical protein
MCHTVTMSLYVPHSYNVSVCATQLQCLYMCHTVTMSIYVPHNYNVSVCATPSPQWLSNSYSWILMSHKILFVHFNFLLWVVTVQWWGWGVWTAEGGDCGLLRVGIVDCWGWGVDCWGWGVDCWGWGWGVWTAEVRVGSVDCWGQWLSSAPMSH